MVKQIIKRDGRIEDFNVDKIRDAIYKAALAAGGDNKVLATELALKVAQRLDDTYKDLAPTIEQIQDMVEKVLIDEQHAKTAVAYIRYREARKKARDTNALIAQTEELFADYLSEEAWEVKENANMQKSVNGLNNYVRESFTKKYWLYNIYPEEVRVAHEDGDIHLHDLGFFGPYCAGWDLRQLLTDGFGGVAGKVESKPAKHLRSFLGQVVNSTFTTQGETAGAQAWSSIDTYCAPFIRYDKMTYEQVRQCIQEFIFNINVPTRVGFQCPFSNLTFDIKVPSTLKDQPVIVGGEIKEDKYGDFQAEMDIFNKAFCSVMLEGDAKGRVFTFPIPTLNITKDFDWNNPVVDAFMEITCKYGIPYFANYINSDLSPEDAVSMCCRLRLDVTELRKRGGGLFGSNPMTGSIGVVTLNMPRIGYLATDEEDFFKRVERLARISQTSLEIKRKIIEKESEKGLYPYSTHFLRSVKERTGRFWDNHFNTIGLVGMNECLLNFMGKDIGTPEGLEFSLKVMNFLRSLMQEFQKESGRSYNLEATPAEGTSYRLARLDRKKFGKDIISAGDEVPYYTNSTQLPASYTDDIMKCVELQDELQYLYTGGTVQHLYLGEKIEDIQVAKKLIKKIFEVSKMPYISLTPTFSVCNEHGYLAGEQWSCPTCGKDTEVYSRVTGYLRPVQNYNDGKKAEYKDRVKFKVKENQLKDVVC
ncbi:MAG: ribonucleoside triphosphate reductase [Christensenellales bacterium]|mgnify:FL=1|nr:ribonucleoside triphosphate reductase [Clostridiales bacterium]